MEETARQITDDYTEAYGKNQLPCEADGNPTDAKAS